MRRTRHNKKISFIGLFLLTVFVNLYLVQLACNLPHLAQRLQPVASTPAHNHSAGHEGKSHTHWETSSPDHHDKRHEHHNDEHPTPSNKSTDCCSDQVYGPFVKSSTSLEASSLAKTPLSFIESLCQALLSLLYKCRITAVSHAPPDPPVPKISDIRIFLHSHTI